MSHFHIVPSKIKGNITIPSSKSQTLRALLFGMMGKGKSVVHSPLQSNDTTAMVNACRNLGAKVDLFDDRIEIVGLNGCINGAENVIDAANSGIVLRFITGLASLSRQPIVITGDQSIRSNRPIQPLLDGLNQLGAHAISTRNNGYAPIIVQGPLHSGKATINGEVSQPVSSLLMASAFADGNFDIAVLNPGETPWVGLTLSWFDRMGISYENRNFEFYRMQGNQRCSDFEYHVPGDLSTAAFPIVAAVITQSELTLHNVDLDDPQGDKELIYALQRMGACIEIDQKNKRIDILKSSKRLNGTKIDINNYSDAIAALAVIGCFAEGTTHLSNVAVARKKECDRIKCLTIELRKMGANIIEMDDGMIIEHSPLKGASLYAHKDHRMAMALAVAALGAKGNSTIEGVECVLKTYPDFRSHFCQLGAKINTTHNI